ncbi:NapC/NirT family cytochrome c [Shewanella sp. 0m-4]
MAKLKQYLVKIWHLMKRPSVHYSVAFLVLGGFVAGVIFWTAFNKGLDMTSTEEFCSSCHQNVYEEMALTAHFTNASGVTAECHDCHVPHNWTDKIARKMQASREIWGYLTGAINTQEKFEAKRREMAEHEWVRLQANNSQECRNCHNLNSMDITLQSPRAANMHSTYLLTGEKTCINCHKGIAHNLPDMKGVDGF